ncbi:hypothetical protein C0991_007088 [Blastosporella zonata]|nr:hypothetical protein C0991_007088 [Blastosporella zonata]
MLLAVVGTRYSGKSQVRDYYVSVHGFLDVQIERDFSETDLPLLRTTVGSLSTPELKNLQPQIDVISLTPRNLDANTLVFPSASELLTYVTKNWQLDFVTTDIRTQNLVKLFVRRPFFMLLSVDAPLTLRFMRSGEKSLERFVQDNDRVMFGVDVSNSSLSDFKDPSCLSNLRELVTVHIFNSFKTISDLHKHLEELNLLDPERLRPGWDAYFMKPK